MRTRNLTIVVLVVLNKLLIQSTKKNALKMRTRNLTIVIQDSEVKLAIY